MAIARIARTLAKTVAIAAGVVVLLLVALTVLLSTGAVTNRVKDMIVPRVSESLGRQLTVQDVKLRVFPRPRVALTGAALAGRPGEAPLVQLDSLEVTLEVWPLVRSFGKDVAIAGIELVNPVVNLVRGKDGTWNYEGIGKSGAATPKAQPQPAPGPESSRNFVVGHAAIQNGTVRFIDERAAGQASVAASQIDLAADHVGVGLPFDATLSAALAGKTKNFNARIHASSLPVSLAGGAPALDGELRLDGLDLGEVRAFLPPAVTGMMTGGRVDAQAKLSTENASYHVDGEGKLSRVELRGQPAQGGFALHAVVDPASGAMQATVDRLALKGPGVDLGGNASYSTPPARIRFAITGPMLDLDQVMGLLPPSRQKPPGTPLLSAQQRQSVRALDVSGTVDIQKVVKGALVATGFKSKVVLDRGALVLQQARAGFYQGTVDASGTRIDLAPAEPKWDLKANMQAIDLGQALQAFSGVPFLAGRSSGSVALDGAGVDWAKLRNALTGQGLMGVKQGALTTADLGGKVLSALSEGLRAAGKTGAAQTLGGVPGKTEVKDLSFDFTIRNGRMTLTKPVAFTAPYGPTRLGGGVALDGTLALEGTATLTRETLQRVLGGTGIPAPASLDLPLRITGPMNAPSVSVDVRQAVVSLVSGVAKQQVQRLQQEIQKKAGKQVGNGLGGLLRGLGVGK